MVTARIKDRTIYTAHLKGKRKKDAGVDERDKEVNKEYYEGR